LTAQTHTHPIEAIYLGAGGGISQFRYNNIDEFRFFSSERKNSISFYAHADFVQKDGRNRKSLKFGYFGFRDKIRSTNGGNGSSNTFSAQIDLYQIQVVAKMGWNLTKKGPLFPYLDLGGSFGVLSENNYEDSNSSFVLGQGSVVSESTDSRNSFRPTLFGLLGEFGLGVKLSERSRLNLAYEQKVFFGGRQDFNRLFYQGAINFGISRRVFEKS